MSEVQELRLQGVPRRRETLPARVRPAQGLKKTEGLGFLEHGFCCNVYGIGDLQCASPRPRGVELQWETLNFISKANKT